MTRIVVNPAPLPGPSMLLELKKIAGLYTCVLQNYRRKQSQRADRVHLGLAVAVAEERFHGLHRLALRVAEVVKYHDLCAGHMLRLQI